MRRFDQLLIQLSLSGGGAPPPWQPLRGHSSVPDDSRACRSAAGGTQTRETGHGQSSITEGQTIRRTGGKQGCVGGEEGPLPSFLLPVSSYLLRGHRRKTEGLTWAGVQSGLWHGLEGRRQARYVSAGRPSVMAHAGPPAYRHLTLSDSALQLRRKVPI